MNGRTHREPGNALPPSNGGSPARAPGTVTTGAATTGSSIPAFPGQPQQQQHFHITHDARGVTVSEEEAHRIEAENTRRLLRYQKLSLILDLDQTIVHAAVDPRIQEWLQDEVQAHAREEVFQFTLPDSPTVYFVKLRPGTRDFLARMHELFELHIYTMGTRAYADQIAKIIDPTSTLFNSRILSRDESGSMTMKSIQRLFPCDQSMVLIVDDRADVWSWADNLIKVEPYHFFTGVGDINAPMVRERVPPLPVRKVSGSPGTEGPTPVTTTTSSSSCDSNPSTSANLGEDDYLSKVTQLLTTIHDTFYRQQASSKPPPSPPRPDVRTITSALKRAILRGVCIVFSSVIPLGRDPETHEVWRAATSFGARCEPNLSARTTHVVCGRAQTAKANAALGMPGVRVVSYAWLLHCIHHFQRVEETPFLLQPVAAAEQAEGGATNAAALKPLQHPLPSDPVDSDEEAILSGARQSPDDIFLHFGREDWGEMDAEVEEALAGSTEEEEDDDDDDEREVEEKDEDPQPARGSGLARVDSAPTTVPPPSPSTARAGSSDSDDWDDFAQGLEEELSEGRPAKKIKQLP